MVPVQYKQIHHKRNFYGALQKLLLVVIIVVKVVKADFFRLGGTTINGPSRWDVIELSKLGFLVQQRILNCV